MKVVHSTAYGCESCVAKSSLFRTRHALPSDEGHASLSRALSGVGIVCGYEPILPLLAAGTLRAILTDWAPMGSGFHAYYSGRWQVPTALLLLAELIRKRAITRTALMRPNRALANVPREA